MLILIITIIIILFFGSYFLSQLFENNLKKLYFFKKITNFYFLIKLKLLIISQTFSLVFITLLKFRYSHSNFSLPNFCKCHTFFFDPHINKNIEIISCHIIRGIYLIIISNSWMKYITYFSWLKNVLPKKRARKAEAIYIKLLFLKKQNNEQYC